jgi:signal transduction histidine kinase
MMTNPAYEKEIVTIILFTSIFFIVISGIIVLFFYFSRKKIIQKELEKKDLQIRHQKEQLHAVITTQEEERERIAQDLHDDISSKLNVVSLNSHLLKKAHLSVQETLDITSSIIELTAKALESTRRIAHDLLPPVLDKFGLNAGMEELCSEFNSTKAVQVHYQNSLVFNPIDKKKHLHIFRIVQELMNNSVRHGKASEITVSFDDNKGIRRCNYTDNGIGFDAKDKKNQKGLGMKNIESRISYLEATLSVDTAIGKGIKVQFNF